MTWEDYLKKTTDEDITNWEIAVKEFIRKGKELGVPLSTMDILREVIKDEQHNIENREQQYDEAKKEAGIGLTTNTGFQPNIHNITYGSCPKCDDEKTKCRCNE